MYGIDQTLEQTADAYRGNPQMLQQKYAQNQNLIDLLALQKLKSEKESAQREMQLKMGGKPPTIADQREQQVMDMTKQEVVQEQAGVMQNKMREQQEAQKRLMQAAGAPQGMIGAAPQPQGGGIMSAMPQRPPSAGISGAAAPNMQRMAGGGIVAFDEGGNVGEAEAQRAYAARRQNPPPREAPRAEPQSGGMPAGLAALLGIRPEDVYRQRAEEVARGANLSLDERARKENQIRESARMAKEDEITNFLLGMAGRSTPGLAIAGGGAAAQTTRNQAMANRHRAEGELIDIGPASRLAGFKAGEAAYGPSMQGLASGVQSAANMAATGEAAASRAQTARDAAELRAQVAREAEAGRSESRATARHKVIIDYVKENQALKLLEMKAINGTAADKAAANALFNQLYRQTEAMIGNTGSAPPTPTAPPGPPTVPFGSLPPRP